MDKERQIRFLYPPFFLIFSILLALYFDNNISLNSILPSLGKDTKIFEIIASLIGGGIAIVILGFIIGTITISLLRLLFLIFGNNNYESLLSESTYDRIFNLLGFKENQKTKKHKFFAAVTFDHELMPNNVHQWIVRRWNSFSVSSNSIMALVLSYPIIKYLNIELNWTWIILISIFGILLLINGINAWKDTMGMIDFQSKCKQKLVPEDNEGN